MIYVPRYVSYCDDGITTCIISWGNCIISPLIMDQQDLNFKASFRWIFPLLAVDIKHKLPCILPRKRLPGKYKISKLIHTGVEDENLITINWYPCRDNFVHGPANERWCYIVTSALIGWLHVQNDSCPWILLDTNVLFSWRWIIDIQTHGYHLSFEVWSLWS